MERCFKPKELEYLKAHPDFQRALEGTLTLPEFENTVTLGNRLLLERDGITPSAQSLRPNSKRDQQHQLPSRE